MAAMSITAAAASVHGDDILRIDEICDRHERALQSGETPNLAEALEGFENEPRTVLLGELMLIEMHHRHDARASETATLKGLKESHPELTHDLEKAVELIKHRIGFGLSQTTQTVSADRGALLERTSLASSKLEVCCPQCHELCEVALDSKSDEVTCDNCGSTFSLSPDASHTNVATALTNIGHFKLTSRLGMGGCGTVWKAYDSQLDRTVAIKIPRAGELRSEDEERFLREAQAAARLKHPHIVPVHEFGRDGKLIYFVSDYIRGISLSSWLTGKQMSIREAVEMATKLADAVHYAHEQGVIHRDIKPSNILLDLRGEPHITDFGLAKLERPDPAEAEGALLGTPAYMSPEQAAGEPQRCDRRTDVYALGVVLFQLLTGEIPFRGNREMLLHQIQFDEPVSPRKLNANIPKDLETLCLKCLQKPMASRYDSAEAMAEDLRRFLRGEPVAARPVSLPARGWRWCMRNRAATAALVLLVGIAIAGPVVATYQSYLRRAAEVANAEKDKVLAALISAGKSNATDDPGIDFSTPLITRTLVESALAHAVSRLEAADAQPTEDEELAYLQMVVGVLSGAKGDYKGAMGHMELASDTLARLHAQAPEETRYEAAKAFCKSSLAQFQLAVENYEASVLAQEKLKEALEAWDALVAKRPDNFSYQRFLADSQVELSLVQSLGEQGPKALKYVMQSKQTADEIAARWPSSAKQLYLIACELAQCQPVLSPRTGDQAATLVE